MNTQQAAPYQQQLENMRAALLANIAAQRGGDVSRADAAVEHFGRSDDSDAQVATAKADEFALEEHDTVELDAIEAALARIKAGTYGACTDCGSAIKPARLQAAPATHRCLACQQKAEQHRNT